MQFRFDAAIEFVPDWFWNHNILCAISQETFRAHACRVTSETVQEFRQCPSHYDLVCPAFVQETLKTETFGSMVDKTINLYNATTVWTDNGWNCLTFLPEPNASSFLHWRHSAKDKLTSLTYFTQAFILSSLTCQLMAPIDEETREKYPARKSKGGDYNCSCRVLKRLFKCHSACTVIGFPLLLPFALSQCVRCHSKHEEAFSDAWNSLHGRITS